MWADWEGIATAFLEETGIGPPVDPWVVAWALDLNVCWAAPGEPTHLRGDTIYVRMGDRDERQGFGVGHESSHRVIVLAGEEDSEAACDAVTSCIMLPQIDFIRDYRRTDGCLFELKELHPHASFEAITRRIVSLTQSVAWIEDRRGGVLVRKPKLIVSEGLLWSHSNPTSIEREAMEGARAGCGKCEPIGGVQGYAIIEGDFVRLISISAVDSLEP